MSVRRERDPKRFEGARFLYEWNRQLYFENKEAELKLEERALNPYFPRRRNENPKHDVYGAL